MTQKSITIQASLDARQAAYFVQKAGKFESEIQVSVDEKRINAKSIMSVLSLGGTKGDQVIVKINGTDEVEAANGIEVLFETVLAHA